MLMNKGKENRKRKLENSDVGTKIYTMNKKQDNLKRLKEKEKMKKKKKKCTDNDEAASFIKY